MGEIDWENFINIKPDTLSEKEKDDLYINVSNWSPDFSVDKKRLIHFILVIQEILKFKATQVECLSIELDELAVRQGKEESSKLNQYVREVQQLREEVEYYKELSRGSSQSTYVINEQVRAEIVKLEIQNEDLLNELKKLEKDLVSEKDEVKKYAAQVTVLEKEKQELIRELRTFQDDAAAEKDAKIIKLLPEFETDKQENLIDIIREKNKHINQLLEDIELAEEENLSLKTKLTNVRDELAETTTHMTEITAELSAIKEINERFEMEQVDSCEKIKGLMFQIEELVEEKNQINEQLDEYIKMFNAKVEEWRDVLKSKDEEIFKLNQDKEKFSSSLAFHNSEESVMTNLNMKIIQQEKEIKILQQELQKATEEINNCTDLIEKLKEKKAHITSIPEFSQSSMPYLEKKIKFLEEKLIDAEEDALAKAEEMSSLVVQLRKYEAGVFGLPEALIKISKLEKKLEKKMLQIEKLVEICNNLEIKIDNFEEENVILRKRLGLSATEEIDTSSTRLKFKKDEQILQSLKLQLEKKEEELVQTKLKCRKILKLLKSCSRPEVSSISKKSEDGASKQIEEEEIKSKLDAIIKENDALRKGMHEILESIRQQNCSGTVEVQSTCLERLLEALDSRHISGWYHPAMRLQAQLSTEEGKNEELRNQVRFLKTEEKKKASELQNAYLKIQSLENDLTPCLETVKQVEEKISADEKLPEANSTNQLTGYEQSQRIIQLESELQNLKYKFDREKIEVEAAKDAFVLEKENLLSEIVKLECQVEQFRNQNLDNNLLNLAEQSSRIAVLERKIVFLQNWESVLRQGNDELRRRVLEDEERMLRDILKLQNDKSKLLREVEKLENDMLSGVSKEKFQSLKNELEIMKAKYQQAISISLSKDEEEEKKMLQAEINSLQSEKQEILNQLKLTKEKLTIAEEFSKGETLLKGNERESGIPNLAEKLAACEIREISERQEKENFEKLNETLKVEKQQTEKRNEELLEEVAKLSEIIEKHKEVEKVLRDEGIRKFLEEEQSNLMERTKDLQKKYENLMLEKENIQELFEISQGQCRALQEWRDSDKILLASLNEQILVLQASSDSKAAVSRLSHELAMAKLVSSQLLKKNKDFEMKIYKLFAQITEWETKNKEKSKEVLNEKKKFVALTEYLCQTIDEVRNLYGWSIKFRNLEDVFHAKVDLEKKNKILSDRIREANIQIKEYSLKREEMEVQLDCLENLKSAFKGESESLVRWHNKSTELRLKEAKCRRENEYLIGEIVQLQNGLKKLNEEIAALEEDNVKKEKEWEEKQMLWEIAHLQLCELLKEKSGGRKLKEFCDTATNTDSSVEVQKEKFEAQSPNIFESKIRELEVEVSELKKEAKEKNDILLIKQDLVKSLQPTSKIVDFSVSAGREAIENAEKEALKVTVQSFQNIIKQKEETILRYQDLLKESRENYGNACAKFQNELKELNIAMAKQSLEYNKLKNSVQANSSTDENISDVVEKYITKIHELQEELKECQMNLSNMNTLVSSSRQEGDHWKSLAAERLLLVESSRRKFEEELKKEIQNHQEEIKRFQNEIEHLQQDLQTSRNKNDEAVEEKSTESPQQLKAKFLDIDIRQNYLKSDQLSDCTFDKPERQKNNQLSREIKILKEQLSFSKEESIKLKEQVRLLQTRNRRPKTSGSSSTKTESNTTVSEENLVSKVKQLEELLTLSKERERELMELTQKKLKSVEEVARWDERKKSQQTIQQLTAKLKEKEAEVEVLKNKNDSFRNMVYKSEKDKSILESQLKAAKANPAAANSFVEKLAMEKKQLEAEIECLQSKLEDQTRHSSGLGAALLQTKLEEQERKLASFELASKGQNALVEELERIKMTNSSLEKSNLKLESENLALRLQLEKEKAETKCLLDGIRNRPDIYNQETDQLHKNLSKLREENKKLRIGQKETTASNFVGKLREELAKLTEDYKSLKIKYAESIERNIGLEKEVKSCHYQIQLMEEKDLAEALTRPDNIHSTAQLSRELIEAKTKLAHKTHLLGRVKALLLKAAAKEKALHQEVCFLQTMVPKQDLHEKI